MLHRRRPLRNRSYLCINVGISSSIANQKSPARRTRRALLVLEETYFFWVFTVLPEVLSFTSSSFFFSLLLVTGSVCLGVLVVFAMTWKG